MKHDDIMGLMDEYRFPERPAIEDKKLPAGFFPSPIDSAANLGEKLPPIGKLNLQAQQLRHAIADQPTDRIGLAQYFRNFFQSHLGKRLLLARLMCGLPSFVDLTNIGLLRDKDLRAPHQGSVPPVKLALLETPFPQHVVESL
ncbi:MAG TPA: hypothetical protein VFK65_08530 [Candidatus Binatia bacterium]|nr:hypothetical protein [Candidatus Binatia bacterium]